MTLTERIAAQRDRDARGTESVRNVQETRTDSARVPAWVARTIDTRGPIRARKDETGRIAG